MDKNPYIKLNQYSLRSTLQKGIESGEIVEVKFTFKYADPTIKRIAAPKAAPLKKTTAMTGKPKAVIKSKVTTKKPTPKGQEIAAKPKRTVKLQKSPTIKKIDVPTKVVANKTKIRTKVKKET